MNDKDLNPITEHESPSDKNEKVMQKLTEVDLWEFEDDGIVAAEPDLTSATVSDLSFSAGISSHEQSKNSHKIPNTSTPKMFTPHGDVEYNETDEAPGTGIRLRRRKKDFVNIFKTPLTLVEKLGVTALTITLLSASGLSVWYFIKFIPTQDVIAKTTKFPQGGAHVRVIDAKTYWRKPIRTGDNVDTVRRGISVIPAVDLTFEAKNAFIRAFFKDTNNNLIGDVITVPVEGNSQISVTATAGMVDEGMHTAYRTKQEAPWTVEIFEASHANASRDEFSKIFKMDISTEFR